MKRRGLVLLGLVALPSCAADRLPQENTREEVVAYVGRAAELVEAEGGDACGALMQPEWRAGEWYVFILEEEGPVSCHPARPDLEGSPAADLVDPEGRRIGDDFLRVASAAGGSGWVEYVWARPGEATPVPKSSYVERVVGPDGKGYVVGSGGYELP